jgi:hypothetical protein
MCNLYSVTKSQTAIIEASRAMRDTTGNLPPLPGIFPDYRLLSFVMRPTVRANSASRVGACRVRLSSAARR